MTSDYYRVLNIPRGASVDEVHRAYRSLAFRYHPDRNPTPAAAALMANINEAYEVLGEPAKRSLYDNRSSKRADPVGAAVLRAARETLLKKGWELVEDRGQEFVLKHGSRRVSIVLLPELSPEVFREHRNRSLSFCVLLTLRIDPAFSIASASTAVIDVMYSRFYGTFPDDQYKDLFQTFL